MKKNKFTLGWFFISLLMAFCVTACDDDDDNVATVTFPEKQAIGGSASDSEFQTLTFDASTDWTLTSSSTWCYFVTEQAPVAKAADFEKEYTLSGKAGKQTVKVGISDEGQSFDENSVAIITISMNGQESVLAEVTRNKQDRSLKIYQKVIGENQAEEWVEVSTTEGLKAGYNQYQEYKIEANFRFAATNRPEWLAIEGGAIVGAANKEVKFGLQIVEGRPEFYKYVQNGTLSFQDEEGKSLFTYPVHFAGMNPEAMKYEGPNSINWEVSLDGKVFTQTAADVAGSEESQRVYNKYVDYQVIAFDDKFEPIFIEEYEEYGMTMYKLNIYPEDNVNWMHLKKYDQGKVRITIDESTAERKGYVMVFPEALYKKILEDPYDKDYGLFVNEGVDQPQTLRYTYAQNNLLMEFTQKEQKQAGGNAEEPQFKVTYYTPDWSQAEAEVTKVNDEGLAQEYGTDQIFTMAQPNTPMGFQVDPLMGEFSYQSTWFFQAFQGSDLFSDTDDHSITCDDGTALTVWFAQSYTLQQEVHIVIKDNSTWQTLKVLIITPKN